MTVGNQEAVSPFSFILLIFTLWQTLLSLLRLHGMVLQSLKTCSVLKYTVSLPPGFFSSYFFNYRFQLRPVHRGDWSPPFGLCLSHPHSVTTSDQQAALIYSQQLKRDTVLQIVSKCCYESWQQLFYISSLHYTQYEPLEIVKYFPQYTILSLGMTMWWLSESHCAVKTPKSHFSHYLHGLTLLPFLSLLFETFCCWNIKLSLHGV